MTPAKGDRVAVGDADSMLDGEGEAETDIEDEGETVDEREVVGDAEGRREDDELALSDCDEFDEQDAKRVREAVTDIEDEGEADDDSEGKIGPSGNANLKTALLSTTYTVRPSPETAMPVRVVKSALVPTPTAVPDKVPDAPPPASVDTAPAGFTTSTRLEFWSLTYT